MTLKPVSLSKYQITYFILTPWQRTVKGMILGLIKFQSMLYLHVNLCRTCKSTKNWSSDFGLKKLWIVLYFSKGSFKSEETGEFFCRQNRYSKSLSWAENLNFPPKTLNNIFKFSSQDSDLENLFWKSKSSPVRHL